MADRETFALSDIYAILARYPKQRPPLPPAYQAIYEREYRMNREGSSFITSISSGLESWMHKRVADAPAGDLLEIGAGTLNQLQYEAPQSRYDVVEPFAALYADSPALPTITKVYADIGEIAVDQRYDRITSVAVLEHLNDLPGIVARSALLMKDGGVFQAGIPSEGGFMWTLAWRTTTGVAYWLRNGLDYGVLMHHEHLNTAAEIEAVVGQFFGEVKVSRYPLPIRQLSFYSYLEARQPLRDRAARYLGVGA
ncbi:MAG: methyltransferase domain-containing protein [Rhodoglobus sp.]